MYLSLLNMWCCSWNPLKITHVPNCFEVESVMHKPSSLHLWSKGMFLVTRNTHSEQLFFTKTFSNYSLLKSVLKIACLLQSALVFQHNQLCSWLTVLYWNYWRHLIFFIFLSRGKCLQAEVQQSLLKHWHATACWESRTSARVARITVRGKHHSRSLGYSVKQKMKHIFF